MSPLSITVSININGVFNILTYQYNTFNILNTPLILIGMELKMMASYSSSI